MSHIPTPYSCDQKNWRNEPVEHDWYIVGDTHMSYEEDEETGELVEDGLTCTSVAIVVGNATSAPATEDTARFICRACNAHDDLVTALTELYEVCPADNVSQSAAIEQARAALDKATETTP